MTMSHLWSIYIIQTCWGAVGTDMAASQEAHNYQITKHGITLMCDFKRFLNHEPCQDDL